MVSRASNLRSANLNLVPILRALLREASVTRAARALSLSPSATSGALGELRVLLGDPLLIRVGTTMRLTPKAQQLMGRLEDACFALERLLLDQAFDPATETRTFTVGAIDYIGLLVGRRLLDVLSREAPGVRVRFIDVPGDLEKRLSDGTIDLGMVAMNLLSWQGVSSTPTFSDRTVGLVDRRHPLAGKPRPTARELAAFRQVHWDSGLELTARAVRHLGAARRVPDCAVAIQSTTSLGLMVVGSPNVAIVPHALARWMTELAPVALFDLPANSLTIDTAVVWSAVVEADPAHRWFREAIYRALAEVHGP